MACAPLAEELKRFLTNPLPARELLAKYSLDITVDRHGQISIYPTPKPEVIDPYEGLETVGGLGCHGPGAIMLEDSDLPETSPKNLKIALPIIRPSVRKASLRP